MLLSSPQTRRLGTSYARLLIRESLSHDGHGWLEYDRVFRQQRALDPTLPWNTLHPGIHSGTIISQARGSSRFCSYCRESDHSNQECALVYVHSASPLPAQRVSTRHGSMQTICRSWNLGNCVFPGTCSYRHVCSLCSTRHKAKDCPKSSRKQPS